MGFQRFAQYQGLKTLLDSSKVYKNVVGNFCTTQLQRRSQARTHARRASLSASRQLEPESVTCPAVPGELRNSS
eukprot:1797342-Rhodomonas_salina.2